MPDALDGQRILAEAREVAFPRYPGTEGDRRAISFVASRFREAGLEVVEEPFTYDLRLALRALRVTLVSSALLVAGAAALAPTAPALAFALLACGAAAGLTLLAGSPATRRLYASPGPTATRNVTGYRRVDEPRLRLIVLAHHDSKSQSLTLPWRLGLTLLALGGGLALLALLAAGAATGEPSLPPGWSYGLGAVVALALLGLATLRNGNASPGGVDNAGSLAILLALARSLPAEAPSDVELVFLSTGAEEDHMVGAMRWLAARGAWLHDRPVRALNLDGAGAPGRIVLIERYGLGRRFSRGMSAAARDAAGGLGFPFRSIVMPPGIGIDAIPFAQRGVDCLTLSSGGPGRAATAVHSARDVADHLDAGMLERVARLARRIVLDLAGGDFPGAGWVGAASEGNGATCRKIGTFRTTTPAGHKLSLTSDSDRGTKSTSFIAEFLN